MLVRDTYDYDEFVILLLSRDFAHGSVAYRDFMFFHPPGVLVLFRLLEPVTSHWWPAGRAVTLSIDALTALVVWRLALHLWDRRSAVAAGLFYAASPLALVSAVRVGQDPLITFLGALGLMFLVTRHDVMPTIVAGICLGLAVWIKYPAAIFGLVYLVAAPKRLWLWGPAALVTVALAFLPFLGQAHQLYFDTVTFQRTRWTMALDQRIITVALYWPLVNLPALRRLSRRGNPGWLVAGFLCGAIFALSPQTYYHYYVPIVPFAALLAAPGLAAAASRFHPAFAAATLALVGLWALLLDVGGPSPLYVTAAHLSSIAPTVALLERRTPAGSAILADRFEYAYLAHRQSLDHYFWNVGVLVNARYLERRVGRGSSAVLSYGASSGYPRGFIPYLNRHFPGVNTSANRVWFTGGG